MFEIPRSMPTSTCKSRLSTALSTTNMMAKEITRRFVYGRKPLAPTD